MKTEPRADYVPALGFSQLTALYDPVLRLTTREETFKRRLLSQAALAPGMDVLDLACGTGTLAVWAKQQIPGAAVTGVDGDPDVLNRARAKAERANVELAFDQALSTELPYADGRFDRVLSSLFFHHLSTDEKLRTIGEVRRVLKPGGRLHVADWGRPATPIMRALFYGVQLLDGFATTADNVAGRLPELFEEGGLCDVEIRGSVRTVYGTLVLYSASSIRAVPALNTASMHSSLLAKQR